MAAGLLAVPVASAAAETLPTVTVISPAAGETVSGMVTVDFQIEADPADPPTEAEVALGSAHQTLSIPAGTCDAGCRLSATLDTAASRAPGNNADPDRTIRDGEHFVTVFVVTPQSGAFSGYQMVVVDNHRPVITAPDLPDYDQTGINGLTAGDQLTMRLAPVPDPDAGAVIDHVDVHVYGYEQFFPTARLTPPPDGEPWVYAVDTAARQNGLWRAQVIAWDSRGVPSPVLDVRFVVDHGMPFSVDALPDPMPDWFGGGVGVHITGFPLATTWVTRSQVLLDGASLHAIDWWQKPTNFSVSLGSGLLPGGQHTMTFRLTDNRGVVSEKDVAVDIDAGPTAAWAADPGDTAVAAGSPARFTAALSAYPRTRITRWDLFVDDTQVGVRANCPGDVDTCPTAETADGSWLATTIGAHTLRLEVRSTTGAIRTYTETVNVVPPAPAQATTLSTKVSASPVTAGQAVTVTGLLKGATGQVLNNHSVSLQYRYRGTTTWHGLATRTTDSTGRAAVRTYPARGTEYRFVYAGQPGLDVSYAPATSSPRSVLVRAKLTAAFADSSVRRGTTAILRVKASPAEPGSRLLLQRYISGRGWVTVAKKLETSTGRASFYLSYRAGSYAFRVVKPATTRLTTSYSPTVRLRVY